MIDPTPTSDALQPRKAPSQAASASASPSSSPNSATAATHPDSAPAAGGTKEFAPLKRTPLYETHVALGAKMVPFAGFEMPVQYPSGITAEHKAVREHAGLFDVSHMGEFDVRGDRMVDFVNYVTSNDVAALADGQVHYSTILYDNGTIVDDCLVYKFAVPIWNLLVGTGKVSPAGLGARDTLRLEMGMALYGNDIDDTVTPLEANLGWLTKINKGDFVGRDALVKQKEKGLWRRLVGFT